MKYKFKLFGEYETEADVMVKWTSTTGTTVRAAWSPVPAVYVDVMLSPFHSQRQVLHALRASIEKEYQAALGIKADLRTPTEAAVVAEVCRVVVCSSVPTVTGEANMGFQVFGRWTFANVRVVDHAYGQWRHLATWSTASAAGPTTATALNLLTISVARAYQSELNTRPDSQLVKDVSRLLAAPLSKLVIQKEAVDWAQPTPATIAEAAETLSKVTGATVMAKSPRFVAQHALRYGDRTSTGPTPADALRSALEDLITRAQAALKEIK